MKEIFFRDFPVVGKSYQLESWDMAQDPTVKETLAIMEITRVESREEQEWNPVLKHREAVSKHYVTFLIDGKPFTRLIAGPATESSPSAPPDTPPGSHQETPAPAEESQ